MPDFSMLTALFYPSLIVLVALVVGFVVERLVLAKLRFIASRTAWQGDDIIVASLRGMIILAFFVVGLYSAVQSAQVSDHWREVMEKAVMVVLILTITVFLSRLAVGFVSMYGQRGGSSFPAASIFRNITKLMVFFLGALVVLQSLGISITPILTALGIGGLAVALALQDTLSNLFAGLHILASRQILPGNFIKLDSGEEGYVTDITWRNTTIRQLPNNMVVVPNSKLASAIVTNYYLPDPELAVLVQVSVSYKSDLRRVEQTVSEVAKAIMCEVQGGIPSFDPFIRYHTFGDSGIHFTVIMRGKEFVDQHLIKHEFIKRLHERFRAEGIEIPYPQRDVHVHANGMEKVS
jgi:small-conductance mechanosensitive channel